MTNTEKIEEMVRDFCSVVPKSKSEVRQRIHQALAEDRERVVGMIKKNRDKYCKKGIWDENKPYDWHGYQHASNDLLASLDKPVTDKENY